MAFVDPIECANKCTFVGANISSTYIKTIFMAFVDPIECANECTFLRAIVSTIVETIDAANISTIYATIRTAIVLSNSRTLCAAVFKSF